MKIGRYQIIEEIGRGAMGVVYKAHDPNLDIILALKVLRKDRVTNEPFVRRFMAEARALGRLDHAEIVRVFNVDRDGDDVYIAMEFIEGEPVSSLMKKQQFAPEAVADFGIRMANALDYAHKKGIIHRDVKPSNILCTTDGKLKITDFGIAHIEDPSSAEETQAGEILGTPAYMSPEQVLGRPVDGRSDLFSLGIILYEMAASARPFQGQGMSAIFNAITNEVPTPIQTINPKFSRPISEVIMKCLSKSPETRYSDCRELATVMRSAVEKLATDVPDSKPATGITYKNVSVIGTSRSKYIMAAIVFIGLAIFMVFNYFSSRNSSATAKVKPAQSEEQHTAPPPSRETPRQPQKETPANETSGAAVVKQDSVPPAKSEPPLPPAKDAAGAAVLKQNVPKEAVQEKQPVRVSKTKVPAATASVKKPVAADTNSAQSHRDVADPDCPGCTCQDLLTKMSMGIDSLTPAQRNYFNRHCR